jgi:CRISPR system Cascade subunit CasE
MSYLTRLTLRRTPSAAALQALIDPADESRRVDAHHRLVWSAFAGDPDRRRDFLWREEGQGRFLVLSPRPPEAAELFEPPEVRPFAPNLRTGDRLAFLLRANATRTEAPGREAGVRHKRFHRDLVMDLLRLVPKHDRAPARADLAQQAGEAWMHRVGGRTGFEPASVVVRAYRVLQLPGRGQNARVGVMDLEGVLEVTRAEEFHEALTRGFGRAKAFGCGLMLIRRA